MTEINITRFVEDVVAYEFSGSIEERGPDAAKKARRNAVAETDDRPLFETEADLKALRDHMRGFGAWDEEEIARRSAQECNTLFIQLVSGDIREAKFLCPGDGPGDIDWDKHSKLAHDGVLSGNMFLATVEDHEGRVFYYLGK